MICILKVIHYFWLMFENFRKMCLKFYHLGPPKFLSDPELAWQAALKKTGVKFIID